MFTERYMTMTMAGKLLGVHPDTIKRLVKEGKLKKHLTGEIDLESFESLKAEWDERKKVGNAKWLRHGQTV